MNIPWHDFFPTVRTVAVVGWSQDPSRPSHEVAQALAEMGLAVIAVNPKHAGEAALGGVCVARLEDIPGPVDIVDVFRASEHVLPVAQSAIAIGARCLWQQRGVANLEAHALAEQAGLLSVYDRCLKIEYRAWRQAR
jgi:predicted CoA-binding protein